MDKKVGKAYIFVHKIHSQPNKRWSNKVLDRYRSAMTYIRTHADPLVIEEVENDLHEMILSIHCDCEVCK